MDENEVKEIKWGNIKKKKVGGVNACTTKSLWEVREDRWPTSVAMILDDYDDHHDSVLRMSVF